MSLLDAFYMTFKSEGLDELSDETIEADKNLNKLEKDSDKAEKTIKKLGNAIEKDGVKRLKGLALQLSRSIAPMVVFGKAIKDTFQYVSDALEVAQAAQEAGMSLEAFQQKDGNKYVLYTRDDVNNAKELEMTMRDIRMGTASIGANISRLLLPALIAVSKIAKKVIDFFEEHGTLMQAAFIGLGIAITVAAIPAIIRMGISLWGALAPILPIILGVTAAIVAFALIAEDLYKWMHGEPSVAELLFGDFETAKGKIIEVFNKIKTAFEPFIGALIDYLKTSWDYLKAIFDFVVAIISYVFDKAKPLFNLIGEGLGKQFETIKDMGKFVLDLITNLLKVGSAIGKIVTKGLNIATDKINGSHADGLDYVPFDGYIAELHKGERVQTADEANDWRSGLLAAKKAVNFTANYPLNSIPQGAISNAYNNSNATRTINIGDITIQTQATNAQGIAQDLASYIKQAVISLDDGMLA